MRGETNSEKVRRLMDEIGKSARSPGGVFFTGGTSAVLEGWRATTLDVDLSLDPEPSGFFECIARLKESLDLNIELASPADFIPRLPEWRERSQFIARVGTVDFFHYDFYSQALSKIERSHPKDRDDVRAMIDRGLITPSRLIELFRSVQPNLIRFPSIDARALAAKVANFSAETS